MKKLLFAILIALALISCSMPTSKNSADTASTSAPTAKPVAYVYNSKWESISLSDLVLKVAAKSVKGLARDATASDYTLADVQAAADTYNAATTDDQLFVETDETPIAESPNVNAYIILSTTHKVVDSYLNVLRTDFVDRYIAWQAQLTLDSMDNDNIECLLYIDNTPPEEIVYVAPPPKLWVALLDTTAKKIYWSQKYDTEADAIFRYQKGIYPQAEMYNMSDVDDGIDVPGDVWEAYIGATEFSY